MSEEVKNQTEGKELAYSEEELAGLLAQNQKLQEKENEGEGIKADYLILLMLTKGIPLEPIKYHI